jgi:hypothetical protein
MVYAPTFSIQKLSKLQDFLWLQQNKLQHRQVLLDIFNV